MELRQLSYFVAVAEDGGFGRAAERLGIVQPAVSQQIGRLERELGVRLFDRTTRHVRLTAAGQRLLPEARAVLAATDRTRQVAADIVAGTDGIFRLGASPAPGRRYYPTLEELAVIAPRLRVQLTKAPLADRLDAVRSGELQAALARAVEEAPGLEMLPIWTEPLLVALPAGHPLAAHTELKLKQLGELPLRLAPREKNPPFYDFIQQANRDAGIEPPVGPPFTHLQNTLADIAADGASWTVFYPTSQPPAARSIAFRPLAEPRLTTYLAVLPDPPSPALRHFLDACAKAAA